MGHHQIIIIGAGTAGLTVGNMLLRKNPKLDIAFIDPSEKHYYQPAWTLVGAGYYDINATERAQANYIPSNSTWVKEAVIELTPDQNTLKTDSGRQFTYDYLVLCPGIKIDWDKIKGLRENLGTNGVCSNYAFNQAPYTYKCIQNFEGGTALFTSPNTPIKCGGAPQKIMYLASDHFQRKGILDKSDVRFTGAGGKIFGVKVFADALNKVVNRYGIQTDWFHNLKEIKGEEKIAVFDILENGKPIREVEKKYDMIHVAPPMSAPDFIKNSPVANETGWVDVDKYNLQHIRYPNIFGLGDAAGTPNAKTGAAVRKQAPVVANNLLNLLKKNSNFEAYDGYGSCPLVTGKGKLILAEFKYDGIPAPSFPFNLAKERYSMWLLKKYFLPWMYWNRMIKGRP